MAALPLASARLCKLWIPFPNHLLDADYFFKNSLISIFSLFFPGFQSRFYHIHDLNDLSRIAASNAATDHVTK